MDEVQFDFAYMFHYSERPGTLAAKKYADNIPDATKKRRLDEIIQRQREHSLLRNKTDLGRVYKVLIEGDSKRSAEYLQGRNSANKVVVFPKEQYKKGQYVHVLIDDCTGGTLVGQVVGS
jgi:tRNA-2-methylthio-N6-dimethylallyladenosine synthase